ncbi:hypothetical protein LshimejAT787_0101900 [Lyophyllum shimeji]|uniref:Uncharacterized protein n=1 Tax=Lyophyllum shimeji TaxID=47721 RepID=A0A9P3PCH7_LYOSH|nr:hypothetical protein LshimejAT787_0101900 [Lyophyllum shimeji]
MSSIVSGSTYETTADGLGVGLAFGIFMGLILALVVASCCSRPCLCKEEDPEENPEKQPAPSPAVWPYSVSEGQTDAWKSNSTVDMALPPKALLVEKGTEESHSSCATVVLIGFSVPQEMDGS